MTEGLEETAVVDVLVGVEVGLVHDGAGGDAGGLEAAHRLDVAHGPRPRRDLGVHLVLVLPAGEDGGEAEVGGEIVASHGGAEPAPFGVGGDRDGEPLVLAGAGVGAVGGHGGVAVPQRRGDAVVHGVVGEGFAQEGGDVLGLVELR